MSRPVLPGLLAGRRLPNVWDLVAIVVVFGALVGVAHVAARTFLPISAPRALSVSLDPARLPAYAVRTTLRMFAALACSLVFTFTYATAAAKSRRASVVLIPLLDILQSVPILGFLTFTVVFFMNLFPGQVMGLELAAVFAIFTSQAWNMAFSLFQSLRTIPGDLEQVARSFRLTAWQKFWRLEVPFAIPGLVWNTMLSMSGAWFFVVASEAITVGNHTWLLPGIGSYVALALERRDLAAVGWAILAMLVVILLYDQVLFRPLVAWSDRFRFETTASAAAEDPWLLRLFRRTDLLRRLGDAVGGAVDAFTGLPLALPRRRSEPAGRPSRMVDALWLAVLLAVLAFGLRWIVGFLAGTLSWTELGRVVVLGCYTLIRVLVLIALASLIWVPVGVWIGLRPLWARRVQPLVQFLAAFPANLLFPPVVLLIVYFHLDPDIWLSPLMILGTQWYILFNVIAGAAAFPGDLREAAASLGLRGRLWWFRAILPGIFSYYVTGAITASGGAWNAAIVAEVAGWGHTTLVAHGLGAYIATATAQGNMPHVLLGVAVMSGFVVLFNRLLWRPMYDYAARRLTFA
jgi:NitT/TauT family transport system permease protein